MKFWHKTANEVIASRYFRHAHFKGGGSTTTVQQRNIPNQTANEAILENGLMQYDVTGLNNASNVLNQGINAISKTYNPDWQNLSNTYNQTMSDISNRYTDLANGNLPDSFATARKQALNSDLSGTVGNAISSLGSRGILNSSVTNNSMNNISQNASDTLAKNYSSDLLTEAGLLNQKAGNAANILTNNATAQAASYTQPTSLLNFSSQLSTPAQNMYNTMYSGRMGTAGATQSSSTNDGGASKWGAVGSIGSALLIACFIGDTRVRTPHGYKQIADIKFGDEVYSLDDNDQLCVEKVLQILPPHMRPVVEAIFEDGTVIGTTESQRFYTSPWFEYVERIKKPVLTFSRDKVHLVKAEPTGRQDLVYDIVVSGRNIFFADGIAVEGYGD